MTTKTEWKIDLPITKPLSLNDRLHWAEKARQVRFLRRAVYLLARSKQIPPCDHVMTELHYVPRDSRRRDALNLVATLKACEDGIVDAGVVKDDTPQYVTSVMPIIHDPVRARHGRLFLVVRHCNPELQETK